MTINRKIQEKRDEYRVQIINDSEMKITGKNYYCHKIKINDKWEITQLAHRMMKSDRPDYRREILALKLHRPSPKSGGIFYKNLKRDSKIFIFISKCFFDRLVCFLQIFLHQIISQ